MKTFRVVLIGNQGTGKTTFFNLITNSMEKTQYGGQSCTRQIVQSSTVQGQGFEVIDTPGFDTYNDRLNHAAGIVAALTYGTVNRIIIVIKYDRDDYMVRQLKNCIKLINRYLYLVTVLITYWDECKQETQKELTRITNFLQQQFKIESILFHSKNNDPKNIINQIDQILFNSKNNSFKQIQLMDSEIFSSMEFIEYTDDADQEQVVEKHRNQVKKQFRVIAKVYLQFINSLDVKNQYYLEILHKCILKIKEEGKKLVENFEQQNGEQILNLVDIYGNNLQYLHYIYLKKEIQEDVANVIQIAQTKMKQSQKHFFNMLKKCPKCNQIWFKVIGCDNQTICGNRDQSNFDFSILNPQSQIHLARNQENQITVIGQEQNLIDEEQQKQNYLFNYLVNIKEIKKIGLDELKIDQILIQLYGTEEYMKKIIEETKLGSFDIDDLITKIVQSAKMTKSGIQLLYDSPTIKKNNQNKGIGCGNLIDWKTIKPLSQEEINQLHFSQDLLDYFSDQEQIVNDEIQWLNKAYKQILQDEIQKHQQNIKLI